VIFNRFTQFIRFKRAFFSGYTVRQCLTVGAYCPGGASGSPKLTDPIDTNQGVLNY